jgi:hypothetical protein
MTRVQPMVRRIETDTPLMTRLVRQPKTPERDSQIADLAVRYWPLVMCLILTASVNVTAWTSEFGLASESYAEQVTDARNLLALWGVG